MEKVAGGSAKEPGVRAGAKRKTGLLAEMKRAISHLRQIIDRYMQENEASELLIDRLHDLESQMMEGLYKAVPLEKSSARARKKQEKQAQAAVPKVGA